MCVFVSHWSGWIWSSLARVGPGRGAGSSTATLKSSIVMKFEKKLKRQKSGSNGQCIPRLTEKHHSNVSTCSARLIQLEHQRTLFLGKFVCT